MKVLIDECLPRGLKRLISGYECFTVREMGWSGRKNGELLSLADQRFDVLLTIDQGLQFEQNLANRNLALIVLKARSNDLEDLAPLIPQLLSALSLIKPAQILTVSV